MAWEKPDFDGAYRTYIDRYFNRDHPEVPQDPNQTGPVILHYHRWFVAPIMQAMWARLAPILNIPPSSNVLIVGAGFGWGVEAFMAETGVTSCVGIEISAYVNAEKDNTEEAEIDAAITAAGLDPASGRGAAIKAYCYDGQPRTNVVVLNENMQTNQSRNAIRSALGNNWPDVVIIENLVDANTTEAEITQLNNAANLIPGPPRIIWNVRRDYPPLTLQAIQTLTGAEVISNDGLHLVP